MTDSTAFIGADARRRQRAALLALLQVGPVSTIEARDRLGIAHPAGRVLELRKLGYLIATQRGEAYDMQGRPHVGALYVLKDGGIVQHG